MPCDLNLAEHQRQILDAAETMLTAKYPMSRLRGGAPDDLAAIAGFGAFAMGAPEPGGYAAFGLVDEVLLHVRLGRHLVSTRALAAAIAGRLVVELGRNDLAEQTASGGVAVCAAMPAADSLLLVDAADAHAAVLFQERGLALVDLSTTSGEPATGLGRSVPLTRLRGSHVTTVGASAGAGLRRTADLLVCAQLLGVAEATRDLAVSYAKVRHQFGRPIGAFQAIKHHCASMAVASEMLSAQLDMAAIAAQDGRDDAPFQVAALTLLAPRIAFANARTCIQIHGGIGFSAEADAHHYLKQAHVLRLLLSRTDLLELPAPLAPLRALDEGI